MTIGKKIGGGFCVVILLTMVLGIWSVVSMNSGANVSEEIANDRLPRFTLWTEMLNNLLESSYFAMLYFSAGESEKEVEKAYGYLDEVDKSLAKIKQLNSIIHYPNTARVVKKLEEDFEKYKNMMKNDHVLYKESEDRVLQMMMAASASLKAFGKLIIIMTQTQEGFIQDGNDAAAMQYAQNIARANVIYGRIGGIYQDLLRAERDNNLHEFANIQKRIPMIKDDAKEVDQALLRDECHTLFAQTMDSYEKFAGLADKVASTLHEFLTRLKTRRALFLSMYDEAFKMVVLTTSNSTKMVSNATTMLRDSTFIVSILLVVVLCLGILVGIIITRLIVKPLAATQKFAEEVAGGDFNRELDVNTNDETGKLADSLRTMVTALKDNISEAQAQSEQAIRATEKAKEATARAEEAARRAENAKREGMLDAAAQLEKMVEVISSASSQLTAQIGQADKVATDSAQRLQEAAAAMNEMNASVHEVAQNAGSASEISADTRGKALTGQQVVRDVVQSMDDVHQRSLTLKEDMVQLNERAQDINRIMGVISDIADQTNLLALNAAIEAARAGEAGRGFAVVADEVRKLAEKTMTSTQDVSHAILAIQESTAKSMNGMDMAVESVGKATQLASQSGSALEEIVSTVEATSDQVHAIATASEEQSAASEQINRSISEVNNMSQQTAEAMRESATAVADMAAQAQRLTALIENMKRA